MTTTPEQTSPAWQPKTPEQEMEMARVLESIMFDRLHNYVQKTAHETMALHMAGPVDGFTVPIAATVIKKA